MSFESGSVTFRMFYLQQKLPVDFLQRFAKMALPPIETCNDTSIAGWVTGRHLQDRNIIFDTAMFAGYLRLALCEAERIIPESALVTECRMEELARMQAENRAELDRKTRTEIRKEIEARLRPSMPPQFKGMAFIHIPDSDLVYCEATSDSQIDFIEAMFRQTMGFGLIPVTPQAYAAKRLNLDVRDLSASSYSPECDDDSAEQSIGQDFLTWLWFFSETQGGIVKTPSVGDFAVMIEGPLTFVSDGQGAHEAILKNGTPEISAEAKSALMCGKKLRKSRLMLSRGQDTWQVTIDADQFIFRGLKLPEGEKLELASRFQERMAAISTFTTAFLEIYEKFIALRTGHKWDATVLEIHNWVTERTARK